jgi:hypothetical protein
LKALLTHQRHRPRRYDALHFDFKLIVQAPRLDALTEPSALRKL